MSSSFITVGIINPSSTSIGNAYYSQLLQNEIAFPQDKIIFEMIDLTTTTTLSSSIKAVVIVGDASLVLGRSFLQQCQQLFTTFKNPKLLLSQGLPSVITSDLIGSLNMFDRIVVHTSTDLTNLTSVDKQNTLFDRVVYYPDLIYMLQNVALPSPSANLADGISKVIGISLPYSIAYNNPFYKTLIGNFVNALVHYYIIEVDSAAIQFQILVMGEDDDLKVATDVYYQCQSVFLGDSFPITISQTSFTDIIDARDYLTANLTHFISYDLTSTQLSVLAGLPVVALKPSNATDNEVDKLALDLNIDSQCLVNVTISDRYNLPSGLTENDLVSALQYITSTSVTAAKFPSTQTQCINYIVNVLTNTRSGQGVIVGPPNSGTGTTTTMALSTEQITLRVNEMMESVQAFNASRNQYDPGLVALYLCYLVTRRNESSKYHHGLQLLLDTVCVLDELVQSGKLEGALRWLVKDAFANGLTYDFPSTTTPPSWLTHSAASTFIHQPNFAISLDSVFRQPSYEGVHRAGWAFVTAGLGELAVTDAPIFLDLYSDSTFGWMEEILNYEQVLPYTQPWCGIFHHGFDNNESYDVNSAIAKPSFQASLAHCQCLITLSEDLKSKLQLGLMQLQVATPELVIPPVVAVVHPTEMVDRSSQFTMDAFLNNEDRKIVQIGSFYRNSFSIYALPLGGQDEFPNELDLGKCHLKAVDSARYFRPDNLFTAMTTLDQALGTENEFGDATTISRSICGSSSISCISRSMCRSDSGDVYTTNNVYLQGLIKVAEKMDSSVTIMEHVSNADYDELLTQNIVFIDLIDASAVNSAIECIVRNTPILVNPLPAVVEALGEGYPFYFTTLTEAAAKANDITMITAATDYLAAMDKSALRLDTFLNDFQVKLTPYMTVTPSTPAMMSKRVKITHKRKTTHHTQRAKRMRR